MRVASEGILLLIVRGSMPVIFDRVFLVQKTLSILFNNYPHCEHRLFLCVYPCMCCQLAPLKYSGRRSWISLTNSSVLPALELTDYSAADSFSSLSLRTSSESRLARAWIREPRIRDGAFLT